MIRNSQARHADDPSITRHARLRWEERAPDERPVEISEVWDESIPVEAPAVRRASAVRLYEPYGLLLVEEYGMVKTVLHADYSNLDLGDLIECEHCGSWMDPSIDVRSCPWCGEGFCGVRGDGRLTVTRKRGG